ncbi:MAG: hypothetical protein RBS84_09875 [Kiritimatiellia bacterium]|jgi:hypothetical protein|nr:hypothetical protein [Kiritimatiellia bacterium]
MEVSLPDPITNYNRQVIRQRYQRREEYILGHHPGFNLLYWRRIIRAPERVERWGRRLGWSHDQIMLTKALLISRMACIFIDHIIRRMDEAGLLDSAPHRPHKEWEDQYRNFLLLFLGLTEVPDRREIVKLMQRLHRYTVPPAFLLNFRQRHWRRIEQCLTPLLNASGASSLFIRRQFSGHSNPVFTARRICFTAALYSDIQERLYQQQWIYAYSDCMLRLYDQLRKHPAVLTAILELK